MPHSNCEAKSGIKGHNKIVNNNESSPKYYGVAIDIGTTTLSLNLIELNSKSIIDKSVVFNPQIKFGADVISRIKYSTEKEHGLENLHTAIIEGCKKLTEHLCRNFNISPANIEKYAVAANTTMTHIFLNISPESIGKAPYKPAFYESRTVKIKELNLPGNPEGDVYTLPNISGFVGGDVVAGLVASGMCDDKKNKLFLDIGTNGEIVAGNCDKFFACSTAAGPAFEGYKIQYGMYAAQGAIDRVKVENNKVKVGTIGNSKPKGICGSGLIDAISVMIKLKIMDETGKINTNDGNFHLADKISITQKDVREVQLAKSAIRTGIDMLLARTKLDMDEILIGGSFGNYLDAESAICIGLLPEFESGKIKFLGNTSLAGASMILYSENNKKIAEELVSKIEYIEMAGKPEFNEKFVNNLIFNI